MKLKNRIFSLLILLTLLFSFSFTLTSCFAMNAGSDEIYSKEQLAANIEAETKTDRTYVWQYLDEWDFPSFDGSKFKTIETLYHKHYYKANELPSAYTIAKTIATDFLENTYDTVDLTSSQKVTDQFLYAYVKAIGDKHSFYRTNEQYEDYTSNLSGTFYGIGATVRATEDMTGMLVLEPARNSPAEKAGVLKDDVIIAIDGALISEIGYQEALERVKGKSGTTVVLTIIRGESQIDVPVVRGPIPELSVDKTVIDGVGYIVIKSFKQNTDEMFIEAVDYVIANGAKVIIYDLRNNGGGYLSTVLNMLDYIAKDGSTLISYSNDYDDPEIANDNHSVTLPSVILCNGASASASEVFTVSMRDLAAMQGFPITIVGETTYGKFVMQNTYSLSDGSAITMTVAYYYSPTGKEYNGIGITPDVEISGAQNQYNQAFEEAKKLLSK